MGTHTPSLFLSFSLFLTHPLAPPLPAGVLNECEIILPKVLPDEPQTFAFVVAKGVEMTALFNLAVQGGTAGM